MCDAADVRCCRRSRCAERLRLRQRTLDLHSIHHVCAVANNTVYELSHAIGGRYVRASLFARLTFAVALTPIHLPMVY
jgi:hypothetical protein